MNHAEKALTAALAANREKEALDRLRERYQTEAQRVRRAVASWAPNTHHRAGRSRTGGIPWRGR